MRNKFKYSCTLAGIIITMCLIADSKKAKSCESGRPFFTTLKENICNIYTHAATLYYVLKPQVTTVSKTEHGLQYTFNNGDTIERIGGTIAWRNNNPGCIRYSKISANMGAIGSAYGFAIFPDEETGARAIKTLLMSDSYRNLSIAGAINTYAPPHENNTEWYIKTLCRKVGLPHHTKLCDMTDEQINCVVTTIRTIEGWIAGTETITMAPKSTSPMHKKLIFDTINNALRQNIQTRTM